MLMIDEYNNQKRNVTTLFIREQYSEALEGYKKLKTDYPEIFMNLDDKNNFKEYLTITLNILKCMDYFRKKNHEYFHNCEGDFIDNCEKYILEFDRHANRENLSTKPTIEYFVIVVEYYLSLACSNNNRNYYDEIHRIYRRIFNKFLPENRLELIQKWLTTISDYEFYFFANGYVNVLLEHCRAIKANKDFFNIFDDENTCNNESLIKEIKYCKGRLLDQIAKVLFFNDLDYSDSDSFKEILSLLDESLTINMNDSLAIELKRRVEYLSGIEEQIRRFRHDSNARISSLKSFFRALNRHNLTDEILKFKEKAENDLMVIEGNHDATIEGELANNSYTDEDIHDFFEQYCKIQKSLLDSENIKFEIELNGVYKDDLWYYPKGVLTSVIDTLLNNTREAFERNNISIIKKIIVRINYNKNEVTWVDNAGGIDDIVKNKIFDEYVSIKHNINCSNSGGCGIGLFSARQKLNLINSDIVLSEEQPSKGASFTLKFNIL